VHTPIKVRVVRMPDSLAAVIHTPVLAVVAVAVSGLRSWDPR